MKYEIDSKNRIVAGDLHSNTFLTPEIARLQAGIFTDKGLRAVARKERDAWIAVLEDKEGNIALFNTGYQSEKEALSAAKLALV